MWPKDTLRLKDERVISRTTTSSEDDSLHCYQGDFVDIDLNARIGDLFFRLLKGAGEGAEGGLAMLQDAYGGHRCS
jgi:hypothetical protein